MSEYQGCDNCRYVNRTKDEFPCFDCTHNAIDRWKPMTNADRIRNMSDEELAVYTCEIQRVAIDRNKVDKTEDALKWLQEEVDGDTK